MTESSHTATDRGQSAVIGFALLFGILLLTLVTVQTFAVPTWNQGIEFQHNQRAQEDIQRLGDAVSEVATSGRAGTRTVTLGTRYPTRPFLLNPPDPTGTLRTSDPGEIRIENATAVGETGHYWNGTVRTFSTRHLVYDPGYNEYRSAPATVLESAVVLNTFEQGSSALSGTTLVSGRDVSLTALAGRYSRGSSEAATLTLDPLSAPAETVSVESATPITLSLPTTGSESTWQDLLADERQAAGGYVTSVSVVAGEPHDRLVVTLAANTTYDLRLGQVGVGSNTTDPGPRYITRTGLQETTILDGTDTLLTAEVRDRFDNPESGVQVATEVVDGPGRAELVRGRTDEDGQAVIRYVADGSGTATVAVTYGDAPGAAQTVNYTVRVVSPAGGGGGDGTGGGTVTDPCAPAEWSAANPTRRLTEADEGCTWRNVAGGGLELSNPVLESTSADGSDDANEYLRLVFDATSGGETVRFLIPGDRDGLERQGNGDWNNREVRILRRGPADDSFSEVFDGRLKESVLDRWYRGEEPLDLLVSQSYDGSTSGLSTVRNFVRDNDVDVTFTEVHGEVTLRGG
ncbi:DUF7289 family protein [Halorientalis pallida]|uniref:DUF7289 family protein n=1 Tax=Halorientalis pallida TaxID=2479928 RepID=UPI003C6F61F2